MRARIPLLLPLAFGWFCLSPHTPAAEADEPSATLQIDATQPSAHAIPKFITGKFAEHLGFNIYNGMDAQVLRNPTFAHYPFWTGQMTPDGITSFHFERAQIEQRIREQAERAGWNAAAVPQLIDDYYAGLACWWTRTGSKEQVAVSPDTGVDAGRAQRVEVHQPGLGIAQATWLPLHRTRRYEFELYLRSPDLDSLRITLGPSDSNSVASAVVTLRPNDWQWVRGHLDLPDSLPAEPPARLAILAPSPGQFVVARAFLRPADHLQGADPDVVRFLKESRLPLLRWPGGNFVSAYHWEDGAGPVERRPTRPNYAWGAVEPNTFGTAEFIAFCRSVGCEPMICINGGTGTPEEAARWVEYCNGSTDTPMGRRRAEHGHPEPFRVHHWEVGNELWGHWQAAWTTPAGYADRYRRFAAALLAADPSIQLYACGAPVLWTDNWNRTLLAQDAPNFQIITDHPLIGGDVRRDADPLDVFRNFVFVPTLLERKWAGLRDDMLHAGIKTPALAVTELQLFAHLGPQPPAGAETRLRRDNLVNPGTLAEALYDVLIYHATVRLAPYVVMVTHSAVVNHGGGLRKERELVYANPCHYAQAAFAAFAEARALPSKLQAPTFETPVVLPDLKPHTNTCRASVLDALAATAPDGALLISLVHSGTERPLSLRINWSGFTAAGAARQATLTGDVPWADNNLENPDRVHPTVNNLAVTPTGTDLTLAPLSVTTIAIPPAARKP